MKLNMGSADRMIRLVVAAVIASLHFGGVVTGTAGVFVLIVTGILILTAFIGFCPLYTPFGITTSAPKKVL